VCTGFNNLLSSIIGASNFGNTNAAADRGKQIAGGEFLHFGVIAGSFTFADC